LNLMISNHPLVRSPRAAKRVFDHARGFLPKAYVDSYESKLTPENNCKIVSEFALGMKKAILQEQKNIGKKAGKVDDIAQISMVTPNSYATDIFKTESRSSIVDDILFK